MGQQANVTLNTNVFVPSGTTNGVTSWVYRPTTGFGASFQKLTSKYADPKSGTQIKIDFALSVPVVLAADTGFEAAGTLQRTNTATLSFWVAEDSTVAERTDLYLKVKDLVASAMLIAAVENLDPAFG
ncbi:TPA_asm: coat protein [ssRNA phage Gerhypos.1_20]|uniref:Coat protein n=2 Tax=Fiersviridae TaxID=2842319 RepID=A0A8S5KY53_9VIRU|nr:coat protein [ssRNA phage Gerhypos.1_20]QDH86753.1 MAG: hypothetical protein H1Bulk29353_000002 [Leviviridae sp.]DAD49973.1 TPA_asm: coat protein [ssRNA phage Gerhypos.1_20]